MNNMYSPEERTKCIIFFRILICIRLNERVALRIKVLVHVSTFLGRFAIQGLSIWG
jgi:hypothetical protein